MHHVHLLDPQLLGPGGHYLNHDAQLAAELQRRGIAVTIYARRGCTMDCAGLAPVAAFSHDIFQEVARDAQAWPIENFHALNEAFLGDLCRLAPERFAAEDLVYFPNLLQNQLYAVALWLGRLPAARRPAVAVMLRYLNHAMDYVQARANRELIALYYRFAGRALLAAQPRTQLCADTRELAMAYRKITGLPVLELPNPMDVSGWFAGDPAPRTDPRPVVVYQGHTSPLRGFHFLPEIVARCAALPSRPRFVVQVQDRDAGRASQLGPTLDRLDAMAGPDLQLVPGALAPRDYFALLGGADVVLLPYAPTFYGHGSSGVFTEAASAGKVVVVSPETAAARQGREYRLGIVVARHWSAAAMADATGEALRGLRTLQGQAATAAPRFRREQSATALWDKLFAALPPAANAATRAAA